MAPRFKVPQTLRLRDFYFAVCFFKTVSFLLICRTIVEHPDRFMVLVLSFVLRFP